MIDNKNSVPIVDGERFSNAPSIGLQMKQKNILHSQKNRIEEQDEDAWMDFNLERRNTPTFQPQRSKEVRVKYEEMLKRSMQEIDRLNELLSCRETQISALSVSNRNLANNCDQLKMKYNNLQKESNRDLCQGRQQQYLQEIHRLNGALNLEERKNRQQNQYISKLLEQLKSLQTKNFNKVQKWSENRDEITDVSSGREDERNSRNGWDKTLKSQVSIQQKMRMQRAVQPEQKRPLQFCGFNNNFISQQNRRWF